jgi:hypothetical protein
MDTLQRLLFGRLDIPAAAENGRLRCSSDLAQNFAAGLFSSLNAWQSLWDAPCW